MSANSNFKDTQIRSKDWLDECQNALSMIISKDGGELDPWITNYEILFGEEEWKDSDFNSVAKSKPITQDTEDKRKAYRALLQCNCIGVDLADPIFHVTTMAWLNEARKRNGFVLSRPRGWSVSWEDTMFKSLSMQAQKQGKKYAELLVEAYMKYSYSMCWSLDADNGNVLEMAKRKHPGEDIVVISSTAEKLLSAYITDNLSVRGCFLSKMQYSTGNHLKSNELDMTELDSGDVGTAMHHESITITHKKFEAQNEVRLIVEDCPNDLRKTTMTYRNYATNKQEEMLIKHVDLDSIITSVKIIKNEYVIF